MSGRLCLLVLCIAVSACAPVIEEAVVLEDPTIEEPVQGAPDACDVTGDDGIGGTGCPDAEP